jgi:glucose/mannose-6-phosphate isomerase
MELTEEKIKELDKSAIFSHIKDLGSQFKAAVERSGAIYFTDFPVIRNIILLGTGGGSAVASRLLKSILEKEIDFPVFINQGYSVPKWVNKSTLAVALTVSGDTEETIQAYEQACRQGAFSVVITCGGRLKEIAETYRSTRVDLPVTEMQARSVIGDLFVALLTVFEKLNLLNRYYTDDLDNTISLLNSLSKIYANLENSPALHIATKLRGFTPVLYAGNELHEVTAIRWKNQFGENSKIISHWNTFPELNHDEIVGWEQDAALQKQFKLVFLRDEHDYPRIKKRIDITRDLLSARNIGVIEVFASGATPLERVMSLMYLGDWVSIYLAFLNNTDPTPVELIAELKRHLGV